MHPNVLVKLKSQIPLRRGLIRQFASVFSETEAFSDRKNGRGRIDSFLEKKLLLMTLNVLLIKNGNVVGMINLNSHRDRAFSPDDITLIYTAASQVTSAVQRPKGVKVTERSRLDSPQIIMWF